jgi:hypothetical protein
MCILALRGITSLSEVFVIPREWLFIPLSRSREVRSRVRMFVAGIRVLILKAPGLALDVWDRWF